MPRTRVNSSAFFLPSFYHLSRRFPVSARHSWFRSRARARDLPQTSSRRGRAFRFSFVPFSYGVASKLITKMLAPYHGEWNRSLPPSPSPRRNKQLLALSAFSAKTRRRARPSATRISLSLSLLCFSCKSFLRDVFGPVDELV